MKNKIERVFKLSDNMKMRVNDRKKSIEIVHDIEGKRFSHAIHGKDFTNFKNLVTEAGLHSAGVQAMLAIKKLVMNREKWMPDNQENPERSQWLYEQEQELIKAYNLLSEYTTEKQKQNIDLLSK